MGYPQIVIYEEAMREGMQIESADISADDKVRLLDALSQTGLKHINVGSFVSPRYTPQMAALDDVLQRFTPVDGIHYYFLALNPKGFERAAAYPGLTKQFALPHLRAELCDTFLRRNNNRTQADLPQWWDGIVEKAVASGATEASIDLGAAFGSNFSGPFDLKTRMEWVAKIQARWDAAGIPVTRLGLFDPMSWAMPHWVDETLEAMKADYPHIKHVHMHMHDGRGMALASIYAALRSLDETFTVGVDVTVGGIGGCPYCGNGRATGMAPTEDLVNMLDAMGIETGIRVDKLVEAAWLIEEVIGRPTPSHVAHAGWLPRNSGELYDPNLPLVETLEQAQHFKLGPAVAEDGIRPWAEPLPAAVASF